MLQNLHKSILKRNISNNVIVMLRYYRGSRFDKRKGDKIEERKRKRKRHIGEKIEKRLRRGNSYRGKEKKKIARYIIISRRQWEWNSFDIYIISYSFVNLFWNVAGSGCYVMQINSRAGQRFLIAC